MKNWTPAEEAENLANLFRILKDEKRQSRASFARDHNIPGGTTMIQQHLSGIRPISMDAGIAYANGFGVPLGEISPRLAKEAEQAAGVLDQRTNTSPGPDVKGRVPLISWIQAGEWNGMTHDTMKFDAEEWLPCIKSHSERAYALRVRGDSMTAPFGRSYPEGSIIFIDPERNNPNSGDRIAAKLEGELEATFKVFMKEGDKVWLKPLNPQHPIILDEFEILGTVIGTWIDE